MADQPSEQHTSHETDESLTNQIRQRAYELWEEHGRDEGSAMDFWLRAEHEVKATSNPRTGGADPGQGSAGHE